MPATAQGTGCLFWFEPHFMSRAHTLGA